jgi:hypothetical protein
LLSHFVCLHQVEIHETAAYSPRLQSQTDIQVRLRFRQSKDLRQVALAFGTLADGCCLRVVAKEVEAVGGEEIGEEASVQRLGMLSFYPEVDFS